MFESVEVPILVNPNNMNNETNNGIRIVDNLLSQGNKTVIVGYEFFRLSIDKVPWKSTNGILISSQHNMKDKLLYDNILKNINEVSHRLGLEICNLFIKH